MKKLLALFLSLATVLSLLPLSAIAVDTGRTASVGAVAEEAADVRTGGSCGPNLSWSVSDGILTISGSGSMYDYADKAPWNMDLITKIVVKKGVTTIGDRAFYGAVKVTSVSLPESLVSIGELSFAQLTSLRTLRLPSGLSFLSEDAFLVSRGDGTLDFPQNLTFEVYANTYAQQYLEHSGADYHLVTLPAPRLTFAQNVESGIQLSWNPLSGASGYKVYRATGGGSYTYLGSTSSTSYIDAGAKSGSTYAYAIKATDGIVTSEYSNSVSIVCRSAYCAPAAPSISYLTNTARGVNVVWKQSSGVDGYILYRNNAKIGTFGSKTLSYVDTGATTNNYKYQYTLVAYKTTNGVKSQSPRSITKGIYYMQAAPVASLGKTGSGVKVTWNKVPGSSGYYIFRDNVLVHTSRGASGVTWTDTGARTNGAKYQYKVQCYKDYDGRTFNGVPGTNKVTYYVSSPTIISVSNSSANAAKLTWSKNGKASGYKVEYSTAPDFSYGLKSKTISTNTTSTTITGLTNGTTYYFRVRSIVNIGGSTYQSAVSAKRNLTVYPKSQLREENSAPYVSVSSFWPSDGPYDTLYSEWRCDLDAENTYYNVFCFYEQDQPGSGYAGFQNVDGKHIVIFSMWDTSSCVPTVEYCMDGATKTGFGNEGTGVSVRAPINWKEGQWYAMQVECASRNGKTYYTCYVQPLNGERILVGQISYPVSGLTIRSNTFFLEDFTFNGLERAQSIRSILARRTDGTVIRPTYLVVNHYNSKYFGQANNTLRCTYSQPEPGMISVRSAGWDLISYQTFPATLTY